MEHKITKEMFKGTMIVMIIAELANAFSTVIDGIITSRCLGSDAMSAQGIASSYFSIVSIISGILMVGVQALVVEMVSKGKKENARSIITMGTYVGVGLTVLLTLLMWIMPDQIAILFGATPGDAQTIEGVGAYLKGVSLGAAGWTLFLLLTPIVQLEGGGKICTFSSVLMAVVDILADILFGIVLEMGLFGMGLATGLSHIISLIPMLLFMFSKKCTIKFKFKNPDFKSLGKVIKNGLPRAISMIARTVGPILLNIIVLNIVVGSNMGMSALATQRSLSFCVASVGWGIGGAMLLIGTLYYNERNYSEFKVTLLITIRNILFLVVGLTVVLYFVSPLIGMAYVPNYDTTNKDLFDLTVKAFKYYFISLPFVAFNVAFASYMQAIGKNILTNILNTCIEFVSLVAACYLLSLSGGYEGFFFGFFVGEAVLSLICIVYYFINFYVSKNKYKKLMLPNDFINQDTLVIEKSVHSIEEALAVSEGITSLCVGTKLDKKQIYKLSLCVEEMCVNVFKHGFTKDNKKHNVMVRIVVEGERVVLTLIDDCKMFDITKKLKSWEIDKEHPEKNIGIRMIMLLAKEIHYSNTMNINNLQIIL